MINKFAEKAIQKKAGRYSGTATLIKGAEPIINIGALSGIAVLLCKALGIDIDEKLIAEIGAGATALHSLIIIIQNYFKNKDK